MDEEVSSLSAILLDDSYYAFLHAGKKDLDGLSVLNPENIIPLKARAWLDLAARRAEGEQIDSRHIKKHKLDVFRLYQVIPADTRMELSGAVGTDMTTFLTEMESETVDLRQLGYRRCTLPEVLEGLRNIYGLAG